jgi:hypothetical protein
VTAKNDGARPSCSPGGERIDDERHGDGTPRLTNIRATGDTSSCVQDNVQTLVYRLVHTEDVVPDAPLRW